MGDPLNDPLEQTKNGETIVVSVFSAFIDSVKGKIENLFLKIGH